MNIFYLSKEPGTAARYICDKHLPKMVLETAQLLSTAHWETGGEGPYKRTHKNHPCAVWTRENLCQYTWLVAYGMNLCYEYTRRYGKVHKSQAVIEWAKANPIKVPKGIFKHPPQCMPDHCKHPNTVQAYRNYYRMEKAYMAQWNRSETPYWWKGEANA